jgi:hypothetical protein
MLKKILAYSLRITASQQIVYSLAFVADMNTKANIGDLGKVVVGFE